MGKPTTVAGLAMLDMLSDHAPWFLNGSERAEGQAIAAIEAEAYERGCVAGMAMERFAPTPPDALREAAQDALEALSNTCGCVDPNPFPIETALRAALAQPKEAE